MDDIDWQTAKNNVGPATYTHVMVPVAEIERVKAALKYYQLCDDHKALGALTILDTWLKARGE